MDARASRSLEIRASTSASRAARSSGTLGGWRGAAAISTLVVLAVRVGFPALLKALVRSGSAPTGIVALAATAAATIRARPGASLAALTAGGVLAAALLTDRGASGDREGAASAEAPPG